MGNHGYQLCVHLAIHADQRFMRKLQQLMPTTMQTVRDSPPLEKKKDRVALLHSVCATVIAWIMLCDYSICGECVTVMMIEVI